MRAPLLSLFAILTLAGCSQHDTEESNPVYKNPVDHKTYVAEGGWKLYKPNAPQAEKPKPNPKVKLGSVRLLTSEPELAARTSVEALAALIKDVDRMAGEKLGKSNKAFQLLVQFTCRPGGQEIKLAHKGDAPQALLQQFYESLKAIKKLPVKEGTVSFQVDFSITS